MQSQRGPDGRFVPVEEVAPLPDGSFVGAPPSSVPGIPPRLPPRPLSDASPPLFQQSPSDTKTGHGSRPETSVAKTDSTYLVQLPAAERSRVQRAPRMDPHLQFMVGPLLRYDTVDENGLWHGAVLVVSAYVAKYRNRGLLTVTLPLTLQLPIRDLSMSLILF